MRKFGLTVLGIVAVLAFVASGAVWANVMHGEKVKVKLGTIPGVKTSASGDAVFELSKDGMTLHYKLTLKKIDNATMGHVHVVGDNGTPAAILVWLYPAGGTAPSLKEGS
ncbi:MAG TPA: CHRD domain-containing protein, partial [Candidatus Deferrimicrobium sp.]